MPNLEYFIQEHGLSYSVERNGALVHCSILSKFSAVLERNSWLTGSIASALINWLTSQI